MLVTEENLAEARMGVGGYSFKVVKKDLAPKVTLESRCEAGEEARGGESGSAPDSGNV